MSVAILATGTIVIFAIIVTVMCLALWRRRTLRGTALKRIERAWQHATSIGHPTLRVIEADKVLDSALSELGYVGSLGEKLKKAGPRFSDINAVWAAHKLRNTLVHALTSEPTDHDVHRALSAFRRALTDLGLR